jgi:hypothetical protein
MVDVLENYYHLTTMKYLRQPLWIEHWVVETNQYIVKTLQRWPWSWVVFIAPQY